MRKLMCSAALSLVLAGSASAALLAYEPFDYTSGNALLGQSNASTGSVWQRAATATSTTAITVGSGNLTPPTPLQPALGNSLSISGAGNSSGGANRLGFVSGVVTSGTVYYSFEMKVTDLTPSNNVIGGFFVALNNTGDSATTSNPSVAPAKIQVRIDPSDASKYDMQIVSNRTATSSDANWSAAGPFNVNDSLFVVAAYSLDTHTSSFWINPDTSTFGAGSAPSATESDTSDGTSPTQIGSILMRQSPTPGLTLDELRVGTTWADVTSVPEPVSCVLIGMFGAGLTARRRRI
jgi:hypothetical protein